MRMASSAHCRHIDGWASAMTTSATTTSPSTRPLPRCAARRRSNSDADRHGWSRGSSGAGYPRSVSIGPPTAIHLAGRCGAPALLGDVFEPLPGMGNWQTVLLVDGNIGLGGDPRRILARAAELLCRGGRCVAEFDAEAIGIHARWVRLESADDVGPWFRWASVGVDSAATLAGQVGLTLTGVRLIGGRVIAISRGREAPGFAVRCAAHG